MPHPDLVYTRKGSGPTLVLLHGIGHRRQIWDPIIDELAKRYDVIAPDLSGFGETPAFAGGISYEMGNAVDHFVEQFERWGVNKPHIVGNSLGGAIALELGARGAVSSVTALSPAGFFGTFGAVRAIAALFYLRILAVITPEPLLRSIYKTSFGRMLGGFLLYSHPTRQPFDAAFGDAMSLKHATAFERVASKAADYRFTLQVPVPTTIAWAEKDRILIPSQAEIAKERLPYAHHVTMPDTGHVPLVDSPALVVDIIEETIERARQQGEARQRAA